MNLDCDPQEFPCWQHYADHYNTQPITKWVVDLAVSLVSFRLRALAFDRSDEAIWNLYAASHHLHELINIRWRNINFPPFEFEAGAGKYEEIAEKPEVRREGQQLLLRLGFTHKPTTFTDRRV